ncbi:hypothetical protein [Hymenobacter defluvii]|uniref:Alpha/beta hydrolase n=1 Tax=Hymenobacter defluvii TaxID=2054411 RepID=A0ABS3THJ4_9BACT|nr:hypothetical protein [Hymenobacter defluvii]MBO3273144.1 hypothetical protein [Hymenobacter defluvii]
MPHITFIHGISNKPDEDKLREIWYRALAQDTLGNDDAIDLGAAEVTFSMVYWADVLYDKPLEGESIEEETLQEGAEFELAGTSPDAVNGDPNTAWRANLQPDEERLVAALEAKLDANMLADEVLTEPIPIADATLERIPIPWFIKRRIMEQFLRDVHHYLFNVSFSPRPGDTYQVQDVIRERMLARLREGASKEGPHVVVSHSMGTVIAYDCLMRVPGCPAVDALMTIGSPLGLDEVQDKLIPEGTVGNHFPAQNAFPSKVKGTWVNVYDRLDPVTGLDGNIANDFKKEGREVINVIQEANWGKWRHNIVKYLAGPKLRAALREQLGL